MAPHAPQYQEKYTTPVPVPDDRYWYGRMAAPGVRRVTVDDTARWLAAGWNDLWAYPQVSLVYGAGFVVAAYLIFFGLAELGAGSLILPLAAGFMLVGPFAAVGLYEVSRRRRNGQPVSLGNALAAYGRHGSELMVVGLTLMLALLAWVSVAMIIFASFYNTAPPTLGGFVADVLTAPQAPLFLLVGTVAGAVLAAAVFAISAVSLPMIIDKQAEVPPVEAMATSVRAIAINWRPMMGWAAMIVLVTGFGIATFFVGLAITLPLVGHATWHAYRAMIEE